MWFLISFKIWRSGISDWNSSISKWPWCKVTKSCLGKISIRSTKQIKDFNIRDYKKLIWFQIPYSNLTYRKLPLTISGTEFKIYAILFEKTITIALCSPTTLLSEAKFPYVFQPKSHTITDWMQKQTWESWEPLKRLRKM